MEEEKDCDTCKHVDYHDPGGFENLPFLKYCEKKKKYIGYEDMNCDDWVPEIGLMEEKKDCDTCRYEELDFESMPCHECIMELRMQGTPKHWEPKCGDNPKEVCESIEPVKKELYDDGIIPIMKREEEISCTSCEHHAWKGVEDGDFNMKYHIHCQLLNKKIDGYKIMASDCSDYSKFEPIKEGFVVKNKNGSMKADGGKTRWELMVWDVLEEVAQVMTRGAQKYSPYNWQGLPKKRVQGATLRHIIADLMGEELDHEWGLPHLAHALCELIYWRWFEKHGVDNPDD